MTHLQRARRNDLQRAALRLGVLLDLKLPEAEVVVRAAGHHALAVHADVHAPDASLVRLERLYDVSRVQVDEHQLSVLGADHRILVSRQQAAAQSALHVDAPHTLQRPDAPHACVLLSHRPQQVVRREERPRTHVAAVARQTQRQHLLVGARVLGSLPLLLLRGRVVSPKAVELHAVVVQPEEYLHLVAPHEDAPEVEGRQLVRRVDRGDHFQQVRALHVAHARFALLLAALHAALHLLRALGHRAHAVQDELLPHVLRVRERRVST